jgi:arylamine N-acetyltransferase
MNLTIRLARANDHLTSSVHVSTLVTIHGQKYLVDTNVGPSASPTPVPLVHNKPAVDIWKRQRRMLFEPIPGWTVRTPVWRLQIREPNWKSWMDVIAFQETEWTHDDFDILLGGVLGLQLGWFKSRLVCFLLQMENEQPTGYILMNHDEVKRCYKGRTELVRKLYSEEDRLMALEENFGISISDAEARHIVGTAGELEDDEFDSFGAGKL